GDHHERRTDAEALNEVNALDEVGELLALGHERGETNRRKDGCDEDAIEEESEKDDRQDSQPLHRGEEHVGREGTGPPGRAVDDRVLGAAYVRPGGHTLPLSMRCRCTGIMAGFFHAGSTIWPGWAGGRAGWSTPRPVSGSGRRRRRDVGGAKPV